VNGGRAHRASGRLVAGVILVLLGLIYALDSFGILYAGDMIRFWPLILVGIGLTRILQARWPEQRMGGFVLFGIGAVLLLWTLHVVWFRPRQVWPVVLLLVGGSLIWRAIGRRPTAVGNPGPAGAANPAERVLAGAREELADWRERSSPQRGEVAGSEGERPRAEGFLSANMEGAGSYLNEFAIMGGGDRIVRSQDFRGGEVTAIMGGFAIDLRGAAIAGDSATINVFTLWGGVELKVPEDWSVVISAVPILGGTTNSARAFRQGDAAAKTLIVKGTAIMGGIEVKN
jgi:hypothetical protein